jgi:hypothetical protein
MENEKFSRSLLKEFLVIRQWEGSPNQLRPNLYFVQQFWQLSGGYFFNLETSLF